MQHTLSIMVEPLPLLTLQCCWCMKLRSTRSLCGLKTKGGTPHEKVWKGSDTKMTALVISMDLRFFTQNLFLYLHSYLHRNICSAKQRENQRQVSGCGISSPSEKGFCSILGVSQVYMKKKETILPIWALTKHLHFQFKDRLSPAGKTFSTCSFCSAYPHPVMQWGTKHQCNDCDFL